MTTPPVFDASRFSLITEAGQPQIALIENHVATPGRWRLTQTWLTLEPRAESALVAAIMTFCLALASLMYWSDVLGARSWMAATGESVFQQHRYYQLWTSLFAHADAGHLASNSFLFFILSYFLYGYFGPWVSPVAAFVISGVTNWFVLKGYASDTTLVGASGVVYWMGGAWLVFYFALNRQKSLGTRLVRALGVAFLIFMPAEAFKASTSYLAHFYGFLSGIIFASSYFAIHKAKFRSVERRVFEIEELSDDLDESAQVRHESHEST